MFFCFFFFMWNFVSCILSVGFIIHGLSTSSLPCKGVPEPTVGTSTLDLLEDTSYDTCVAPLSHGSKKAKITLEMFHHTNTMLQVVIAVSKDASCNPPGVVLAVETVGNNLVECTLVDDDNSNVNVKVCSYICHCNSCCAFIHIHFYNLHVFRLQNVNWQLCDIQICFS